MIESSSKNDVCKLKFKIINDDFEKLIENKALKK